MGAKILNGAVIGSDSIIAAGAVIAEGTIIEPGSLVMGIPGKLRRKLSDDEKQSIRQYATNYYDYKETYLADPGIR
jgi:carbonic anhydrase/acetyltransferase-like protein (isoleucine patch superfamily)